MSLQKAAESMLESSEKDVRMVDDFIGGVYVETARNFEVTRRTAENMMYSHLTNREAAADLQPVRDSAKDPKIQNNDPCPCGSGRKYKKCCR